MENDGKESYKDGDQSEDLSVEYECSSNESVDMVNLTVDEVEADIINANGFEKLITDLTIEDIWGLYYGFVSQKDLKTVDANGNINTRQLVCNKAGERHWKHLKRDNRQREHMTITRVNCKARIWFIHHYRTSEYNHPLCPPKYRHLIAANRGLDEADKTQADSLRACGVKTCHIMGYMVSQKGGYDKVDFTSKDLHNHINTADDIVPTLRCGAMASICWKLCDISSKNSADYRKISGELLKLISKVQNKGDAQARLSPTSALIGDPAVVKLKGAPRKVPKGQKRRRCSHYKSSRHFVRTCPLLAKEDSPAEYSNVEDETMTEEITLTQETLKDKTNTSGIEVTKVPDAATTKIPGLPQYPMHHYPVVLPYQPYGGVLPIPFILFQMTWRTSTNILLLPELHHILSFLMSRRILVDPVIAIHGLDF
ncbi:hypothetical protein Ahy_A04g020373 [Arachis hypogaea]|uniref:FAR1 domain-containing protein n=1 Tax=Arachis hypogaea TaxID=3818 RepID=A0A445DHK0_ARAHY|nr:hypothetical protein Ahy_A04g020373 [Arachis hypogaea]